MVGALFAHLKINDPFVKSIPALIMLDFMFLPYNTVIQRLFNQISIINTLISFLYRLILQKNTTTWHLTLK